MFRILVLILIIVFVSCSNHPKRFKDLTDADFQHETLEVNGNTIHIKSSETINENQSFLELEFSDKEFMNDCRKYADSLIRNNFQNNSIENYSPELLDNLIDLYNSKKIKCSENAFVNSIGVAMGDYLVKNLGMKWIIVKDETGKDYGTTITQIKLTNFPLNSVKKDIDLRGNGSMKTIYLMTMKNIKDLTKK